MKRLISTILLISTFMNVVAQEEVYFFKKMKNRKFALFNKISNEQITEAIYDRGTCFKNMCRAYKNEYVGFIDFKGREKIPFIYTSAYYPSEGLIAVFNGEKWGVIDEEGSVKIPFKFSSISNFEQGLCYTSIIYNDQYKYGFIDKKGDFVIEPKYDNAYSFSEGFAPVQNGEKWGFINKKGKEITSFKYCRVEAFKDGIAQVSIDCGVEVSGDCAIGYSTKGFINTKGEEIVPLVFDEIRVWEKIKRIIVSRGRGSALYDYTGNMVVPEGKYNSINRIDDENNLIEVTVDTERGYFNGFINLKGKEIIPPQYSFSSHFINGLIYANKYATKEEIEELRKHKRTFSYHRKGVIDSTGNIIIPLKYEDVSVLKNAYFKVKDYNNNGQSIYAYFNSKGKQKLPFAYKYATDFSANGYALVKERDSNVYKTIDTVGKIISNLKYDDIDPFIKNDLIAVKENNKWGYINAHNELVIDCKYDEANRFNNQLARVFINGKYGFINTKGEIIIPIKFDKAHFYFIDEIEELELKGKKYFFDKKGNEIKTITIN